MASLRTSATPSAFRKFDGSMRERVRSILWSPTFDGMLMVWILASVAAMLVEVVSKPGSPLSLHAEAFAQWITWIFGIELALRLYVLRNLKRFLRTYWVDLLAVAPLFRPLRILRVLRLLRLFRLGLVLNRWISRFESTFSEGYREYVVVAVLSATLVLTGSMGIFFLEGRTNAEVGTFRKALWWATYSTMAGEPVGASPQTFYGRLLLLILMLGGMTVFALLTGTISALMVERLRYTLEVRDVQLEDLEDHIIVCGWNRGGARLISELGLSKRFRNKSVVIVAEFPKGEAPDIEFKHIERERIFTVHKDYTRVQVLEEAQIRRASLAILLADKIGRRSDQDRDARTVLAALSIEKLNPTIFTCVELLHQENAHPLRLAGVEEIVVASELSSTLLAHASLNDGLVTLFEEVLTSSYGNVFHKLILPDAWIGLDFGTAFQRAKSEHDAILVSVERKKTGEIPWEQTVNPASDFTLLEGDRLTYISKAAIPG